MIMKAIGVLSIYFVGILTGIYAATQIERSINKNICGCKKKKTTYPNFVKKHYKGKDRK